MINIAILLVSNLLYFVKKELKRVKKMCKSEELIVSVSKKFRLSARKLFLTYPNIKLSREEVLEQLVCKLGVSNIKEYLIAKENHVKEGNEHIHVYINLFSKINIINERFFDLFDPINNKCIHGFTENTNQLEIVMQLLII